MVVSNVEIRSAADLQINPRRKRVDRLVKYFFISSAVTTFAVTVAIIATLLVLLFMLPWMMNKMTAYTEQLILNIPTYAK